MTPQQSAAPHTPGAAGGEAPAKGGTGERTAHPGGRRGRSPRQGGVPGAKPPLGVRVAKPPPREAKPSTNDESEAVRAFRGHTSPSHSWS
ncbi:hypothetical protein H181DRAFT_01414 [Streptomyces sp. WMMB 714]|nr:hypothetical protein H181DRAFT_01414 [Streptomyces sp. WMMB 714]